VTVTESRVPAGWYADPLGLPQLRWWDNHAWTEHVSDAQQPLVPLEEPAHVPAASEHGGSGWTEVARLLHGSDSSSEPTVIRVTSPGLPPLTIDCRERVYWWSLPLDRFPGSPPPLSARLDRRDEAELPGSAGFDAEPLLWMIGTAAFSTAPAPWLGAEVRVRLRRWPNLTALPHDERHIRMLSMLSHAALSAEDLARLGSVSVPTASAVVGALSLMGVLRATEQLDAVPPDSVRPVTVPPAGLFARLVTRLRG
jgi:hypothetical protein